MDLTVCTQVSLLFHEEISVTNSTGRKPHCCHDIIREEPHKRRVIVPWWYFQPGLVTEFWSQEHSHAIAVSSIFFNLFFQLGLLRSRRLTCRWSSPSCEQLSAYEQVSSPHRAGRTSCNSFLSISIFSRWGNDCQWKTSNQNSLPILFSGLAFSFYSPFNRKSVKIQFFSKPSRFPVSFSASLQGWEPQLEKYSLTVLVLFPGIFMFQLSVSTWLQNYWNLFSVLPVICCR